VLELTRPRDWKFELREACLTTSRKSTFADQAWALVEVTKYGTGFDAGRVGRASP
jgi:hypothetical protein